MANNYFNHESPLTRHTLGRAEEVNGIFEAIVAGFDKLPSPSALLEGRVTYADDTGTANAYKVTLTVAPQSYQGGLNFVMKAANANTGPSTVDVNGLGVKPIKRFDGEDLEADDIQAGMLVHLGYDGADFRILSVHGADVALAHASALAAQSSASAAANSANSASSSAASALSLYNSFRGIYYGAQSSDPATDPNGNPVGAGDWYFNTTLGVPRIYTGSAWTDVVGVFYGRTAAEAAANVTPVDYAYPELDVRRYGAKLDGVADDSAALQAAIDVAVEHISATIELPAGILRLASPVNPYGNRTYNPDGSPSGSSNLRYGAPRNAIVFKGASRTGTTIWADNVEGAFKPDAGQDPIRDEFEMHCRDIRFRGSSKTGRPLILDRDLCRPGRFTFKDCMFTEFEYGYCYDDYSGAEGKRGHVVFEKCEFRGNKYGFSSIANVTTLKDCWIERNDEWGLRLPESTDTFLMSGGVIQYNCEVGNEYTSQLIVQGDLSAVSFQGVYFEPRSASKDSTGPLILFEKGPNGLGQIAGLSFRDCYFQGSGNTDPSTWSTYLIRVPDHSFAIIGLTVDGGVLKNFRLDSDNQLIRVDGSSAVIVDCEIRGVAVSNLRDVSGAQLVSLLTGTFEATPFTWHAGDRILALHANVGRSTLYASRVAMGGGSVEIVSGQVSAAGSVNSSMGGVSVNKTGPGVYGVTITQTKAQLDSFYPIIAQAVPTSAGDYTANAIRTGTGAFTVYTYLAGVPTDCAFSFMAAVRRR